jgi:FolB domain-containing protein
MKNEMDKVIIKDLLVRGVIGIHDWEREKPQDILINIVIFTDIKKAGETDDIEHSANYRTIAKKTIACAETSERFTVEALAEDIAKLCLKETNVKMVRVRVEKPGAVRFAKSVGVEIERNNPD